MRSRNRGSLLVLAFAGFWTSAVLLAQESADTPSDKTKAAVDKFKNAPAAIGKTLQGLKDAAKDKLREALAGKTETAPKAESQSERVNLTVPAKAPEAAAPPLKEGGRDPFRPMTLRTRVGTRARADLSPLERVDLSQLKIVGIVWEIKQPRAMVEDSAGLGYIVKVGTPIGINEGTVKAIHRNQIVVEEFVDDIYGVRKKVERSLNLATE